jgi:hypothetical protein
VLFEDEREFLYERSAGYQGGTGASNVSEYSKKSKCLAYDSGGSCFSMRTDLKESPINRILIPHLKPLDQS